MNTDTDRAPLEPWQREDAARLKKLFEERSTMGQLKFGQKFDIGTQGAVWQYLNGVRPLNLRAAVRFANGLGVQVADFSPTLAAELPDSINTPMEGLRRLVQDMPGDSGQQALDFIRYKFERAEGMIASEKATSYMNMIDRIIADLEQKKKAAPDHE